MILGLLYDRVAPHPECTERLASELYSRMVRAAPIRSLPDDVPKDLRFIYEFPDALELGQLDIRRKSPKMVVKEFLEKLQSFEKFKDVPAGLVAKEGAEGEWPLGFGLKTNPARATQRRLGIPGAKRNLETGKRWWKFW